FETDTREIFAVRRYRDAIGIPGRRDVSHDAECVGIQDSDGVDSALRDIKSGSVRRDHHSRRPHTPQARNQWRGYDALPGKDLSVRQIDALDQVIVAVGDEKTTAAHRHVIGSAAADGSA